LKVAASLDYIF